MEPLDFSEIHPFLECPEQLANQTTPFQIAVANHPQTPRHLLEVLAKSQNSQIASAATLHVNLSGEMDEGWQEMAEAAMKTAPLEENDRLVVELLNYAPVAEFFLSKWITGDRLIQALENPYLLQRHRVKLLERLARSPIIEARLKSAASPETPRSSLDRLAGDLELPIRIAIKFHPNSPTEVIERVENQHKIAENWNADPQELAILADSPWSWIRQAVAQNPATPPEILAQLARDEEEKIQLAVARNFASPAEVLDLLVEHYWSEVTEAIALHPNASESALSQLIPRHHYYISERSNLPAIIFNQLVKYCGNNYKLKLIQDSNTPGSDLAQILDCPREWLHDLIRHPNILVSTLEHLAQEPDAWVRVAVFQNPKTPELLRTQLLEELARDANPKIRLAVATSERISEVLRIQLLEQLINVSEDELAKSKDFWFSRFCYAELMD